MAHFTSPLDQCSLSIRLPLLSTKTELSGITEPCLFFIPGMNLSKIEKHSDMANLLLRLDFDKDIKQVLLFLKDLGIEENQLGAFLSKNYAIFAEDLENLKTR